jgi:phage tail-like protein
LASSDQQPPPYFSGQYQFSLTIDGKEVGAFTECTGLSVQVDVEEVKEGGQNQFTHKLPGRMKWPNLVLKRGVTDTDELFDWFRKTSGDGFAGEGDKLKRGTASVTLLDAKKSPVRSWKFDGAFPVRWAGPTLAATSKDVAMEELEIAHHGFTTG